MQYFGSTSLAGTVVWQDADNSSPASLGGGATTGTLYFPGAPLTLQGNSAGTYGQVIAQSVSVAGDATMAITGQ
jgi:hypothetical protein